MVGIMDTAEFGVYLFIMDAPAGCTKVDCRAYDRAFYLLHPSTHSVSEVPINAETVVRY